MSEAPPRPPTFVAWRRVVVWAPLLAPSLLLFLRGPFVLLVVNACCQKTHCAPTTARARSLGASLSLSVKSARDIQSWKKASKQKKPGIPRQRGKFWPRGGFVINPPRLLFPPRGVCVCVCALLVVVAVAIVCRHRPLPLPSSAVCLPSSCLRKCCLVGCSGGVVD